MRISGYGSGGGGFGKKGSDRGRDFKKKHRVGDKLHGMMLRWERPGLAWVRVDGQELLAEIGSAPQPGQALFFLVRQLDPNIVLQEISAAHANAAPLFSELVQSFLKKRLSFESSCRSFFQQAEKKQTLSTFARQQAYQEWLRTTPPAQEFHHELLGQLAAVNQALSFKGIGRLCFWPWLLPEARGLEVLTYVRPAKKQKKDTTNPPNTTDDADAILEFILGFELDHVGRCELRLLYRKPQASFRILLEHTKHAQQCAKLIATRLEMPQILQQQCLGTGRLPAGPPTVLAPFLKAESQIMRRGFSTRV